MPITIAVDVMSGDRGPKTAVVAMKETLAKDPELVLIAVGDEKILTPLVDEHKRISIHDAPEVIKMEDDPLKVLRNRKSSMFASIALVEQKKADAAMSAGNTGALMGMARIQLKMIKGYSRPAIASFVPCNRCKDSFCMLDLGANLDRDTEMLVSFAYLGDALYRSVTGEKAPRVGILNIGTESLKGGKEILEASKILKESPLNFVGNVEANSLYDKVADVVVCDGFSGNVFLKTMEGLSVMIKSMLLDAFSKNFIAKLGAIASLPVLSGLKEVMDARKYNGAAFLGLNGLVIKSHGNADEVAFQAALEFASKQARMDLVSMIKEQRLNSLST